MLVISYCCAALLAALLLSYWTYHRGRAAGLGAGFANASDFYLSALNTQDAAFVRQQKKTEMYRLAYKEQYALAYRLTRDLENAYSEIADYESDQSLGTDQHGYLLR